MPFLPLITMILSFFLQKKSGMKSGKAALISAGIGLGTYAFTRYTATGQKWENGLRSFFGAKAYDPEGKALEAVAAGAEHSATGTGTHNSGLLTAAGVASVLDAAKPFAPAATAAAAGWTFKGFIKDHPWLTTALVGGGLYLLIKRG